MAYIDDICVPLIRILEHNAGLPTHQFAGHMANIDFWIEEVRHCVAVIDGYNDRFEKLKWGQAEYERDHPHVLSDPAGWSQKVGRDPLLKKSSHDSDRQRLRRQLSKVVDQIIDRALRDNLIDLARADDLREQVSAR